MVPAEKLSRTLVREALKGSKAALALRLRRFVLVWSLFVSLGCLTVAVFAVGAARDYQIDRLQSAYRAAVQENLILRSEWTALTGARRLVAIAHRLQYGTPSEGLVITLATPGDRTSGDARPSLWRTWTAALSRLRISLLRVLAAL